MDSNISEIVREFLDELTRARMEFVLVGGIAMLAYVRGRNTKDIDLIVSLADLKKIAGLEITYQDRDFARAAFRGLQIDILKTENRLFSIVREEYSSETALAGSSIKIATPEGLVLLKLYALPSLYRQGEFERVAIYETDIAILMQRFTLSRSSLVPVLKPLLTETDIAALNDILNDIEKRIRRFREQPSKYDAK